MAKIELKNVTKSYGAVQVIKGIDLTIENGEFVVFVGPSGCGKSTLLRLIAGLEDTTSGVIDIDGKDATNLPPAKRGLAMVFQSYALYPHMTVRKNIAFPLKMAGMDQAEQDKRVERAAKVLNLSNYLDRRPGQLSGGQRQRIGIARALYRDPTLLIMDEATSALDNITERVVMEAVDRIRADKTIILIAHRLSTVKTCDTIFLMDRGRLLAQGSYDELLAGNEVFRRMVAGGAEDAHAAI